MENSPFPAPLDILRRRTDELSKLIADNSTKLSEITVAISLLQNDQAYLEVKVLNSDTFTSCWSRYLTHPGTIKEVLGELLTQQKGLASVRADLLSESEAIEKQLSAMRMNETETNSGDQ